MPYLIILKKTPFQPFRFSIFCNSASLHSGGKIFIFDLIKIWLCKYYFQLLNVSPDNNGIPRQLYAHCLKTFQKIPNFPFLSSHKVQKQTLKTNIFNFCVHYSFNVWTHEYNVNTSFFFFFAAIGEAVTGRRWNIPSSRLEWGGTMTLFKTSLSIFPDELQLGLLHSVRRAGFCLILLE